MNSHSMEAGPLPAHTSMATLDDVENDLTLASGGGACVLLTADPMSALTATREIVSRSCTSRKVIDVLDCHTTDAAALRVALCDQILSPPFPGDGCSALLIREVHALAPADQTLLANLLETLRFGGARRVFASSSVSLFQRVRAGSFDERLFYRLNVIHIIVN